MEHQLDIIGDVAVIAIREEYIDASNSKEFRQAMSSLLEAHSKVIFDMSKVQFVDSSGCGALLSCLRELNSRKGELKLCGISKPVRGLFELVRMHKIFDILDSREQALSSFAVKV